MDALRNDLEASRSAAECASSCRLSPSPKWAARPARFLIRDPSDSISAIQRMTDESASGAFKSVIK